MSVYKTLRFVVDHPLNKNHRASAVVRFLKWQVGSRLVPGPVIIEWVNGTRIIVRPGETGMTQNVYCGLHEFVDMAFVLHVVGVKDLFIDVGANSGSYTVLACGARGASGICFEPVPSTFARLLANMAANDLGQRVVPMNVGLSDRDGELLFTRDGDTTNHVLRDGEECVNPISVPVVALDSVMGDRRPTAMKIDVEGFEGRVLAGAARTLAADSLHSVIMEANPEQEVAGAYGSSQHDLLSTMANYGFFPHVYDPFSRTLTRIADAAPSSRNTLFVRDTKYVRDRIASAPRTFVLGAVF
jgi:FkbM family methyltransferase